MTLLKKWLILSHRYLGIALGLIIVVWFASGIVMIYSGGMPRLSPEVRLEHMPPLDLSRVRLGPAEAANRASMDVADRISLVTVMERPAYRFGGRGATTVFADTGEPLDEIGVAQARGVASRFAGVPESRVEFMRTVTRPDQWTIGIGRAGTLHKFRVNDEAGTELYVSPSTAEVVLPTTRRIRTLAWFGPITHWLYFVPLRLNQPLWYRIVVWSSALACVVAVLGLVLGVVRFRRTRPFSLAGAIPYTGWMRWHYVSGVVFGVFTLTWAYSGLLSMEPFAWTNATGLEVDRDAMTGGPVDLAGFPALDAAALAPLAGGRPIKEIEFARIQDDPYYVVRLGHAAIDARRERLHQPYPIVGLAERDRLLVAARSMTVRDTPFSPESLVARLRTALPDVPIVEQAVLSEYDAYYYSRGNQRPLPVLRVKFADPAETWVYVDPAMSQVLAEIHRLNRVERWLYSGLHSLDFSFWYSRRPLWDIGMIVLSLGGLTTSAIGLWLGMKRVGRAAAGIGVRARATVPREDAVASAVPAGGSRLSATEPRRSGS
jgi:uncharacterized iron-regulated membrane protein